MTDTVVEADSPESPIEVSDPEGKGLLDTMMWLREPDRTDDEIGIVLSTAAMSLADRSEDQAPFIIMLVEIALAAWMSKGAMSEATKPDRTVLGGGYMRDLVD